ELMEVSCEELDYLTHDLNTLHALGAKMTGLGFGGCVIALFEKSAIPDEATQKDLKKRYNKRFHKTLSIKTIA
ncbi:MAG: galactokinase, partial [Bacillota bacterium]